MSRIFSLDGEMFIYASTLEQAVSLYKKEIDDDCLPDMFKEYPLDTIIAANLMTGIEGYEEIYAFQAISAYERYGFKSPYILDYEEI